MRKTVLILAAGLVFLPEVMHAAEFAVDQVGQQFSLKSVTIKAGDIVKFANGDDVTHNISIEDGDGNDDDLGLQKPGEAITSKFAKAGEYSVRCHIHPKMKMKVTVQ